MSIKTITYDIDTDVIVIGGGLAGLCAAIEAAKRGRRGHAAGKTRGVRRQQRAVGRIAGVRGHRHAEGRGHQRQ